MNMIAVVTTCILLGLSNFAVTSQLGKIPPDLLPMESNYHPGKSSQDIRGFMESDDTYKTVQSRKRLLTLIEKNADEVEQKVVLFLKTLRIFASNSGFDYWAFEPQIEEYRNDLADIEFTVETRPQFEISIGAQLEFAKHLFSVLVATTEKMKRYHKSRLPGHSLVFEIMDINVCSMILLNAHEESDISIDKCSKQLRFLHEAYTLLMEKYQSMGPKQAHMRIFEIQALQTKHILEFLDSSLEASTDIVEESVE